MEQHTWLRKCSLMLTIVSSHHKLLLISIAHISLATLAMDVMMVHMHVHIQTYIRLNFFVGRDFWTNHWHSEGKITHYNRYSWCHLWFLEVSSDEEAINLMNDSQYGLTASVWTNAALNPDSETAFIKLVDELHTGTVFLNRCVNTAHHETGWD